MRPVVSVSYELIFQILNTILILGILILIINLIYKFIKKLKLREKEESRVRELEYKVSELENKIYKDEKLKTYKAKIYKNKELKIEEISFKKFIGRKVVEITELHPVICFSDGAYLRIECPWRLRDKESIVVGSSEFRGEITHDESYKKLLDLLLNQEVKDIKLDPNIADLSIYFTNNLLLEVFCDSGCYEHWQLDDEGDTFLISFPGGTLY